MRLQLTERVIHSTGLRASNGVFRNTITCILRRAATPLPWKVIFRCGLLLSTQRIVHPGARRSISDTQLSALRRMACADQEASAIMQLSKGKTPSNSMCATFNKDVLKGVDVTVDGVNGVCRIGKHYIRCVEREVDPSPARSLR
jgi:hypothetical protein